MDEGSHASCKQSSHVDDVKEVELNQQDAHISFPPFEVVIANIFGQIYFCITIF